MKINNLVTSTILILLTTISHAATQQQNPCAELNGKWKGVWTFENGCRFTMDITASNFNENVQMGIYYKPINCYRHVDFSNTVSGTCNSGKLDLIMHSPYNSYNEFANYFHEIKLTGNVHNNLLTMHNDKVNGFANKQPAS